MRDSMEMIFPGRLGSPGRLAGPRACRQTVQVMKNVWSLAAATPTVP